MKSFKYLAFLLTSLDKNKQFCLQIVAYYWYVKNGVEFMLQGWLIWIMIDVKNKQKILLGKNQPEN